LWICLGTLCRIGELLMAQWKHVDLEARTWFIPKENAKGARGKKQDQLVFLSAFSLRQFKALHTLTGTTEWCFPSRDRKSHIDVKTVSKQVGDRQHRFKDRTTLKGRRNDDSLVLARGDNGDWTPNDLRRTGATMMQALGITPEVVDRCQNHILKGSRVRRHYLKHPYTAEKRDAWVRLGAAIDAILEGTASDPSGEGSIDTFQPKLEAASQSRVAAPPKRVQVEEPPTVDSAPVSNVLVGASNQWNVDTPTNGQADLEHDPPRKFVEPTQESQRL
jgi:hypothetical protein